MSATGGARAQQPEQLAGNHLPGQPEIDLGDLDTDHDSDLDDDEDEAEPLPNWAEVCDTEIRIGGALFDERRPERSQVVLRPAPGKPGGLYRPGMLINQYRLVAIEPRAILLEYPEGQCWLRMGAVHVPRPAAASAPPSAGADKPKKKRGAAFTQDELANGIQQIGPGAFRLRRDFLREAMTRAPRMRTARLRAVGPSGNPNGLELRKLDKGGLLAKLGLQQSDVLKTVNGLSLVSPDGVLGARALLETAKKLSLILERNGHPMSLEFQVE